MRCNACWRELEGRAISTTCGHLLCILVPSPAFYILYIYFIIEIKGCSALHVVSLTAEKGSEDASKILSSDAACPICDQVLSKRYEASNGWLIGIIVFFYSLSNNSTIGMGINAWTNRK